ncbi:heterokaryon incompatibility protein-domain-containing protein, partial [Ilyonectria sp. MPI-CAGE-AT-0026]
YLTLSYRWGSNPIRLLSSNIEAFRRGRPIAELPVLFRDVFEVARQFSIRYVWIDALCIIQDQQDDWAKEASTMHLVYSNSVCTIAASGSTSPDDSLFHEGDPAFIRPGMVQSKLCSDEPQSFYILDYQYWDRQIYEGPLHNRGWVFQERHLSPRTLFFGRHQILWECWTEHKCEAFPQGVPFHHSDKTLNLPKVDLEAPSPQNNVKDVTSMSLWGRLIEEYSRCELTHPSDKLHAIAGVAKWFEKVTGDEYVAGLWKSRFELMLDWRINEPKPRVTQDYRAPSWSWASVD